MKILHLCLKVIVLVVALMSVQGCFVDLLRQENKENLLESKKQWYVSKIVLNDGQELKPIWEGAKSTMSFDTDENRIFGVGVCNNYFATFALKGKKLQVSGVGSSRRMCEENEGMNYEFWFFKGLAGEFAIKKRGGKMELKGAGATYYLE